MCVLLCGCASASYQARLLRCVDNAETIQESRACRAGVDKDFNVVRDGGAE